MPDNASAATGLADLYFRWLDRINRATLALIALLLAVMCGLALLQVLVRVGLSDLGLVSSAPWSEELGRFAMIWMIFLGAAYAFRTGQMVALRVLAERLPARLRLAVNALALLVTLGFAGLMIQVGLQITEFGWRETSPVLQAPKAYVYLAMPISGALIFVNALSTFIEEATARRRAETDRTPGGVS